jgi:dTDP-4-amino-4,6-dideoxygalactose transaminase
MLRNYGSKEKYISEITGYNMRLDEWQAAFLSLKLKYLQQWNSQRRTICNFYFDILSETADIILPVSNREAEHVYHLFVIRTQKRNSLQEYLRSNGIQTLIHYPVPVHLQNAYKYLGYNKGDFPVAEELADTSLSLPIWPGMTKEQTEYTSKKIKEFFSRHG